jgi:hypothetical protein
MIDQRGLAETGRRLQAEDETSHQKLWRKPRYWQEDGVPPVHTLRGSDSTEAGVHAQFE